MSWEGITAKLITTTTQALINKLFREVYAMATFLISFTVMLVIYILIFGTDSIWKLVFLALISAFISSISVAIAVHLNREKQKAELEKLKKDMEKLKGDCKNMEEELTSDLLDFLTAITLMGGEKVGIAKTERFGPVEVFKLFTTFQNPFYFFIPIDRKFDMKRYKHLSLTAIQNTLRKTEEEAIRIIEKL